MPHASDFRTSAGDPVWSSGPGPAFQEGNYTSDPSYNGGQSFTISPPKVNINPATTYESPFFWLILGAVSAGTVFYMIKKGYL